MAKTRLSWPRPHWADLITLTGLILTVNEALLHSGPERPGFQFMFLAMMGVSPAVRIDERRNSRKVARSEVANGVERERNKAESDRIVRSDKLEAERIERADRLHEE